LGNILLTEIKAKNWTWKANFAVWVIEIMWSHIWLRYYRFGPLEWLWRSLTYWKKQPLKKVKKIEPAMELEVA
jgi:uncharacterized membrane protein YeiB